MISLCLIVIDMTAKRTLTLLIKLFRLFFVRPKKIPFLKEIKVLYVTATLNFNIEVNNDCTQ